MDVLPDLDSFFADGLDMAGAPVTPTPVPTIQSVTVGAVVNRSLSVTITATATRHLINESLTIYRMSAA